MKKKRRRPYSTRPRFAWRKQPLPVVGETRFGSWLVTRMWVSVQPGVCLIRWLEITCACGKTLTVLEHNARTKSGGCVHQKRAG